MRHKSHKERTRIPPPKKRMLNEERDTKQCSIPPAVRRRHAHGLVRLHHYAQGFEPWSGGYRGHSSPRPGTAVSRPQERGRVVLCYRRTGHVSRGRRSMLRYGGGRFVVPPPGSPPPLHRVAPPPRSRGHHPPRVFITYCTPPP